MLRRKGGGAEIMSGFVSAEEFRSLGVSDLEAVSLSKAQFTALLNNWRRR